MPVDNIHFVGSIGLENAESVFKSLGEIIGQRARRYPDGETGQRHYWVQWQGKVFSEHPAFEYKAEREALTDTANRTPLFRLKAPDQAATLSFDPVGYALEASQSYKLFEQAKSDGIIPADTRFQVSLPTPVAVIMTFISPEHRALVEPAYARAMERELKTILDTIPYEALAIQWDIAHEVVAHEGGFPFPYKNIFAGTCERVTQLVDLIPDEVQVGVHLCYGDPGHKHIIDPTDLGNCVKFANALQAGSGRNIDFFHMPVLRERNDEAYFAPLGNLDIGNAELVLGLIHYTDGVEGTLQRMETASTFVTTFAIATECGFGRREPDTIPALLKIHADVFDKAV